MLNLTEKEIKEYVDSSLNTLMKIENISQFLDDLMVAIDIPNDKKYVLKKYIYELRDEVNKVFINLDCLNQNLTKRDTVELGFEQDEIEEVPDQDMPF